MADAARPPNSTSTITWDDWSPTFLNYLRLLPGRDGVPLNYVCRESDERNPTPNVDFIDDYVMMAPIHHGEAYTIDAAEVHTLIVKFITGNETAEMKIKSLETKRNGRLDWEALKEHYEGVGIHSFGIIEADSILANLYYIGEKPPHMYWEKFEKQLTHAFAVYTKDEGQNVHSPSMKLRIRLIKVKADFLVHVKAGINIELTRIPMTMSYERALAAFRNEVNRKNPPQMSIASTTRDRRILREINADHSGGRGRGRGRGRGNWVHKTRSDSSIITLTDGQKVEYHPSFNFPPHVFQKMKRADKDRLIRERAEYRNKRKASEISTFNNGQPFTHVNTDNNSQVSQLSQTQANASVSQVNTSDGKTIMGGRNERRDTRN